MKITTKELLDYTKKVLDEACKDSDNSKELAELNKFEKSAVAEFGRRVLDLNFPNLKLYVESYELDFNGAMKINFITQPCTEMIEIKVVI